VPECGGLSAAAKSVLGRLSQRDAKAASAIDKSAIARGLSRRAPYPDHGVGDRPRRPWRGAARADFGDRAVEHLAAGAEFYCRRDRRVADRWGRDLAGEPRRQYCETARPRRLQDADRAAADRDRAILARALPPRCRPSLDPREDVRAVRKWLDAEIGLPHPLVGQQRFTTSGQRDAAVFQHIGLVRDPKRNRDI